MDQGLNTVLKCRMRMNAKNEVSIAGKSFSWLPDYYTIVTALIRMTFSTISSLHIFVAVDTFEVIIVASSH